MLKSSTRPSRTGDSSKHNDDDDDSNVGTYNSTIVNKND